jgi:hypothetical protein
VRRVLADRERGAGGRGHEVAAGTNVDEPVGIDKTLLRSVRSNLDGIIWRRSDAWLTSFVDCSAEGPGSLLGLALGCSEHALGCSEHVCGTGWPSKPWRFPNAIKIVVIDPPAP